MITILRTRNTKVFIGIELGLREPAEQELSSSVLYVDTRYLVIVWEEGTPLTWWRRFAFESGSCYSDDAPTSYSPSPMEFNLSLNPHRHSNDVDSTVSRLISVAASSIVIL